MALLEDDDDLGLGGSEPVSAATPVATFSRKLPAQLGRYTLVEQLGAGGMAEVFLAKQKGPGGFERTVVVKVLFPHLARTERYRKMFQREAALAARLSHTNVVSVLELGPEDGPLFIAMEHVDGISLHKLARRAWTHKRALPLELCAGAIADAALGLAYAHKEGLVHRDVSPDNLMITRNGAVTKVLDFGIAKSADSQTLTRTGELKGKVPFMAPELVRGTEATPLTDIYALGVTFYWLVTGKRPFSGANDIVTLQAIVEQTPKPPRAINDKLPARVDALIMQMIAREPSDRPASATAVHEALRWSLVARHNVVEPFVREMLAVDDGKQAEDDPDTSGFVPSVPSLDVGKAIDLTAAPTPHQATVLEATALAQQPARGRRRWPLLAAAAGALVVVLALVIALSTGERTAPVPSADATPRSPLVVRPDGVQAEDAPAPTPEPAPAAAKPREPKGPKPPKELKEPEEQASARASADTMRVELRAPPAVRWADGATALGGGDRRVVLNAATRFLTAVDGKRGVRSRVPIVKGVADYGALPRGRLQIRATPYADILLGSEPRGSTPYHDVEVVAGEYTVTLRNRGREERRTVTVKPGEVTRVDVRFP
ncbi:MAG: serine/threonine protein kinase [Deltaproteobacteria bacterium]|nr:serine/threonine protein kinase [Deltaproteobacteria bacterium]